jgi:cullin 4
MKARKKLPHSQLMSEIFSQLKSAPPPPLLSPAFPHISSPSSRFSATIADIKMRIESLIEREYLERDKDDSSSYQYLA